MITDVIRKNGWYQTLNESGKEIKKMPESAMGELQRFTDRFMIFIKNGWAVTYDVTFKKISEKRV